MANSKKAKQKQGDRERRKEKKTERERKSTGAQLDIEKSYDSNATTRGNYQCQLLLLQDSSDHPRKKVDAAENPFRWVKIPQHE
jgi:hypothetical protein